MNGRGERLSRAPDLPPVSVVLVNPGVEVPTRAVFAALRKRRGVGAPRPNGWNTARDLVAYLDTTGNDLEAPAKTLAPVGEVLEALRAPDGVLLARMAGSGATCFALFDSLKYARAAAASLARPDWWVQAASLSGH